MNTINLYQASRTKKDNLESSVKNNRKKSRVFSILLVNIVILFVLFSNSFGQTAQDLGKYLSPVEDAPPPGITTLNLTCFVSGIYLNTSETILVRLRDVNTYTVIGQKTAVVTNTGSLSPIIFTIPSDGNYYITIWYKNALETYSKFGGEPFAIGGTTTFNLSSPKTNAYGSNVTPVGLNIWAACSGDVDGDEIIDGADLCIIDNDIYWESINLPLSGLPTDMDANTLITIVDMALADVNVFEFRMRMPW